MLGERGLWYKMSFLEGSSRVPLVITGPGRFEPRRVAASVSLVDLMPTLIELAGGTAHSLDISMDGRSLMPHLRGTGGHDEAIGEYLAEGAAAPIVMIRRGRYKFIHSPADPDQLYDLGHDPCERQNVVDNPACETLIADLRAEVGKRWDLVELDARVRLSQRRRRFVDAALSKGKVHAWDFQPFRNASRQYIRNTMDLDDLEAMARFPPLGRGST
jgi:choline-sulfatase